MTTDFRSDTLTQPTDAMRDAMARAVVGDDVFGEDPTINALEAEGAEHFGLEAALFVASGTMGNQVAVHVHCRPGDELICEERSHVFLSEGGGVARLSGTQARTFRSDSGHPRPEQLAPLVRSTDVHNPRSRLLVLENTHQMAGGTVLGPAAMAGLVGEAGRLGLLVHVDGARIQNAAVAAGCPVAELTRGVDSISMCLSKGLGAPVGSLLAGSREFVAAARCVRKAFGGGMRQAGVLAAAGRIALRSGAQSLPVDHRRAAELADGLSSIEGLSVRPPQTNIVMVDVDGDPPALLQHLSACGIQALQFGPRRVRFVTHRDLDDTAVGVCLDAARSWRRAAPDHGGSLDPDQD